MCGRAGWGDDGAGGSVNLVGGVLSGGVRKIQNAAWCRYAASEVGRGRRGGYWRGYGWEYGWEYGWGSTAGASAGFLMEPVYVVVGWHEGGGRVG